MHAKPSKPDRFLFVKQGKVEWAGTGSTASDWSVYASSTPIGKAECVGYLWSSREAAEQECKEIVERWSWKYNIKVLPTIMPLVVAKSPL
jgi:hypothetical protein